MRSFQQIALRITAALAPLEPWYRALAMLVAVTLIGGFAWSTWEFARDAAQNAARARFEARAGQITEAVRGRMVDYEQVLRGAAGLLAAADSVRRLDWREYVEHLRVEQTYPGIQGVGYAARVTAGSAHEHENAVRAEGLAHYRIHPEGDRPEYAPVVFIEPFVGRNLRSLGFDMYAEPARRAAMQRARDEGEPAISGKVTLIQETGEDVQAGFLMYVAVYRKEMETGTVAQRRGALAGYVYSPFRTDDLMRGILGRLTDVRLQVHDGEPGRGELLYDSAAGAVEHEPEHAWAGTVPMRGRTWGITVSSLPAWEAALERRRPRIAAAVSALIGSLLLAIMWSLATLRARAARLARDMTAELRASREQLALAIEGSDQATFDWNVATGEVVLSRQWARIVGGGTDAPVATDIAALERLVHPDDLAEVRARSEALVRGELFFYEAEHRVRTADGGWRWILSRAKVVERDPAGNPERIAGTNVDVTGRKEVERMKNEFVATVNHELRTPLTAIVGALGLLHRRTEGRLDPEAGAFLSMARQNSERLAALVSDILDTERIQSGMMEYRIEPVEAGPLLDRALSLNAAYAAKYDVRFELGAVPHETRVLCDEERTLQVLTNLLSNAAKFAPAGSIVTLSALPRERFLRCSVADRGPGVPEGFRDRIFQRFSQADGSDTRRKEGTGLGLWISRAIVEKQGGTLDYESVPGEGAVFFFDLPLADTTATPVRPAGNR